MLCILMCSRSDVGSENSIVDFIANCSETANRPECISIFIKFDDDDPKLPQLRDGLAAAKGATRIEFIVTPRAGGYVDLHKAYNDLLRQAPLEAKLFCVLADDARFSRPGWDDLVWNSYDQGCKRFPASRLFVIHQEDRHFGKPLTPSVLSERNEPWPFWTREWVLAQGSIGAIVATDAQTALVEAKLLERYGIDARMITPEPFIVRHVAPSDLPGSYRWEHIRAKTIDELCGPQYGEYVEAVAKGIALRHGEELKTRESPFRRPADLSRYSADVLLDEAMRRAVSDYSNGVDRARYFNSVITSRFVPTMLQGGLESWHVFSKEILRSLYRLIEFHNNKAFADRIFSEFREDGREVKMTNPSKMTNPIKMANPFVGRLQELWSSLFSGDARDAARNANDRAQDCGSVSFEEASVRYTLVRDPSKNPEFIRDVVPKLRASEGKRDALLGLIHYEMNDIEAAFSYWSSALRHEPDNKGYLAAAAIPAYQLRKPLPAAEQYFKMIDASTYAFSSGRLDQRRLEQALKSYGFFIVRGALDSRKLDELRENFERNIENSKATLRELGIDPINAVYPTWCLTPNVDPSKLTSRLRDGWDQRNVTALKFCDREEQAYLSKSFFDLLGKSIIELIANFSGRGNIEVQHDYCMARAIAAASNSEYMTGFAKLHQDARLQARFDDFLTVFIALTPCGVDRPTIGAVPAGLDIYFPQSCDISELPPFLYHKAVLEPGDLWIHTGMTAHGSYQSQGMVPNLPRLSVDVRIFDRANAG